MKKIGFFLLLTVVFASACKEDPPEEMEDTTMNVTITHTYDGASLNFLTDSYRMPEGDSVKFSRLSYLLSNFYLINMNDEKVALENQYAFISAAENMTTFVISGIPKGSYKSFGLHLGIDSAINYGDPNQYPADHPLSPIKNSLHWSWTGGYIFNAFEGTIDNSTDNFVYHVTGGTEIINYEFPINITKGNGALNTTLNYDVAEAFKNPEDLSFAIDGLSAHTQEAPAAVKIFKNLIDVFTLTNLE